MYSSETCTFRLSSYWKFRRSGEERTLRCRDGNVRSSSCIFFFVDKCVGNHWGNIVGKSWRNYGREELHSRNSQLRTSSKANTNSSSSRWTNLNCTFVCIAWKLMWQTNLRSISHFKIVYSLHKYPIAVRIRHEFVVIYLSSQQFYHQTMARWQRGEDERKISIDLANRICFM